MNKPKKKNNLSVFEKIKRIDENGIEYWSARDTGKELDYNECRSWQLIYSGDANRGEA